MLKRQEQNETKASVSMYATEQQIMDLYSRDRIDSVFGYRPGSYGDKVDEILEETVKLSLKSR